MTGSGNDFLILDGRESPAAGWTRDRIVAACDRRNGAGADGLVVLTPEADGIRMHFWNADGSDAAMCGNAALCSTRLAARLGMASGDGMVLMTPMGAVRTRCVGTLHEAELSLDGLEAPRPVTITPGPGEYAPAYLGTVGVPHLVVFVEDVAQVEVDRRGRELRRHPLTGAAGANANFVSPPTPESGGRWRIRTFERGVEGETLACGTGTVAAALALAASGAAELPVPFLSWGRMPLGVRARLDGDTVSDTWLRGEGRLVYEGRFVDD